MAERVDPGAYAADAGGSTSVGSAGIPQQGRQDPSDVSLGQIVQEITTDLSTLMRQELELAKAEMKEEATKAGKGVGSLGGAAVAGHLAIVFVSLALLGALWSMMPFGWAALIVAVLWAVIAAVLAQYGRKKLKNINPKPEQTVESVKEDVEWVRNRNR